MVRLYTRDARGIGDWSGTHKIEWIYHEEDDRYHVEECFIHVGGERRVLADCGSVTKEEYFFLKLQNEHKTTAEQMYSRLLYIMYSRKLRDK